ncbi:hypothetical protein ABIB25_001106 [Nakamurella sp. UYEF19]|uniref:hypothetical protein n=1 Tax=Nakamurella sp. UYEF19 TaxID=1756392 RepID=UPI003391948D
MESANEALDVLRESQDRALHREGIPMFVGLADERPGQDRPAPGQTDIDRGTAVVERMEHYRSALAAQQRDTDMGVVISVLTVTAYEDFDRSVS